MSFQPAQSGIERWADDRWYEITHAGAAVWVAVAVWVALVFLGLALLYAGRQLRAGARVRAARERPYVSMYMEPHPADWHLIELVVRNFGRTAAYDIGFDFVAPPTVAAYENAQDGFADVITLPLPERLPTLAPGQEWRLVWDSARDRDQIGSQIESRFTGFVTYFDRAEEHAGSRRWWRRRRRPLRTEVVLDWEELAPTQRIELMTNHDLARREKQKLELLRGVLTYFQYAGKENRPEVLREEIERVNRAARDVQDRWRSQTVADPADTVRLNVPHGRHSGRPDSKDQP
ncbi:hypothetical protein [Mycobacterium sp. 1274756.6]|uniref:hypothetical protein n=1 Tax=Mycobacterium sp. 1274756.6 TaxID=1834076 RepID=UPI0007FDF20E|nr:hypothetical protein [Mycobacterium sp. 1274756.6]OBJ70953.1 hypothetical protein A5643_08605 [Mycobacterium sp. 1274756.6]